MRSEHDPGARPAEPLRGRGKTLVVSSRQVQLPILSAQQVRDAEAARDELDSALKGVDVVLPSLRIEPVSRTVIDLGCCSAATARGIASALKAANPKVPSHI